MSLKTKKIADQTEKMWFSYRCSHDPEIRERLIIQYLPLVRYVVDRLPLVHLPSFSAEDLISSGIVGLIKALDNFNPGRKVKFQTYAIPRIRGAIIDELRSLDWIPRSLRRKTHLLEKAYLSLQSKFNRPPTDKELAAALDIGTESLNQLRTQITHFPIISLYCTQKDDKGSGMDRSPPLIDIIPSPKTNNPIKTMEKKEIEENLKRIIEQLPERDKQVIILYYYEELTLKEIGEILKVSESRVCQIHSKSILSMRAKLRNSAFKSAYS